MFFVPCPRCGAVVDIPACVVDHDRIDLWNITRCDECDMTFDYDDAEVRSIPDSDSHS